MASLNVASGELSAPFSESDELNRLFQVEKELVFRTLDQLGIELTPEEQRKIQFVPTENMQAFLAYTMGLEDESAGRYREAKEHYQQAAQQDENFTLASRRAGYAGSLDAAGGSKEVAAQKVEAFESTLKKPGTKDLVNSRLQKIANGLGSNFIPGQDSRESAEESVTAGVNLLPETLNVIKPH